MIHLVLHEPRIPPNTGSIGRLCVATRTQLHLIEPLGFSLDDKHLKRAGLDYWPHLDYRVWPNFEAYLAAFPDRRMVVTSARRGRPTPYHRFEWQPGDSIVLGSEDTGLPQAVLDRFPDLIAIPFWGPVRSINLANAASVLLYDFYRATGQLDKRVGKNGKR